jgi:hypothetical protein
MQADLENLGGVAALAAAQAVREGVSPRQIDLARLQQRLVTEGVLYKEVLKRGLEACVGGACVYSDDELASRVNELDADLPLYAYSDMEMDEVFRDRIPLVEICTAGPRALPVLEQALGKASGARCVRIAQALAMLGSQTGVPALIAEIERHLAGGTLPARASNIRHANLPPDQGAMPDAAYLIYALGMARDRRALAVWKQVAGLIEITEESLRDRYRGTFYYVDAVCDGAERLGDAEAIPILEKLHAWPALRDQATRSHFQPDFFLERQAMLELAIGRALARCSSRNGIAILIRYLDDNRALLAEQAHTALIALSDLDRGKDVEAWLAWMHGLSN